MTKLFLIGTISASQYRRLKTEWQTNVLLRRSAIQGLGLYARKFIERNTMLIEYVGQLIRTCLTDRREDYYNSRNMGCYMFKIDDEVTVDATMTGGPARFAKFKFSTSFLLPNKATKKDRYLLINSRLNETHFYVYRSFRVLMEMFVISFSTGTSTTHVILTVRLRLWRLKERRRLSSYLVERSGKGKRYVSRPKHITFINELFNTYSSIQFSFYFLDVHQFPNLTDTIFQLTYDYKFDYEDETDKIPCNCGAYNCRHWMN